MFYCDVIIVIFGGGGGEFKYEIKCRNILYINLLKSYIMVAYKARSDILQ